MARPAKSNAQQTKSRVKYDKMCQLLEDGTIGRWVEIGLTNKQIAESLNINEKTLTVWIDENPKLKDVIRRGKRNVIADAWGALYRRSMGYDYIEETETQREVIDKSGDIVVLTEHKKERKHLPPDPKSAQILLVNFTRQLQLYGGGMPEFCLNQVAIDINNSTKDDGEFKKIEKGLMAIFGENAVIADVEAEDVKDAKED